MSYWTVEKPLEVSEITERESKTERTGVSRMPAGSQNGGYAEAPTATGDPRVLQRRLCSVRTADVSSEVSPGLGHATECLGCYSKLTTI